MVRALYVFIGHSSLAIGARDKTVTTVMVVLSASYSFYRLDAP